LRFDEGYSSYLEVTYSRNLLYNAELIRTGVQRSLLQAFANLYKAMGVGGIGFKLCYFAHVVSRNKCGARKYQRSKDTIYLRKNKGLDRSRMTVGRPIP
jgi:hypothetical protein